ncbi:MAG: hypothetical protein COX65_01235 [Elusimicrobia bacterium CG_4_10_14_0_2_um_filter_56_8]|nr:MAG: hypothetical protein AUJ51_11710 [Elusimicrobia bacterium CG1_02_56_21]PJA17171.1 MAG: hypothetical protein COX65_01235 [Elusimicrobia bacterium CG_4_10_14_0_2_um_filter_56_8]
MGTLRVLLSDILLEIKLRAALSGFRPLFFILQPSCRFKRRPGQNTVEYLLLLAVVAGLTAMMGILFHKKILGGIFTLVGMIIGAGKPTT